MNDTAQTIIKVSRIIILSFMRTHALQEWKPEDCWWFGLMHAWGFPRLFKEGPPITADKLFNALHEFEIPEECFKQSGVYTALILDHIAYIFQEVQTRDGQVTLKIAPHMKDEGFNKCDHTFIRVGIVV